MSPRKPKTRRWLQERRSDGHSRRARRQGYRSRAVYKLEEIDRAERLVKEGMSVLELGAAPGGWTQYLARRVGPEGRIVAVDLTEMAPVSNVTFIRGDFADPEVQQAVSRVLGTADLVLSDMAPDITGIGDVDRARFGALLDAELELARRVLRAGGSMLVKVFEGPEISTFRERCRQSFAEVVVRKPAASRPRSREYYLLGRRFRQDTAPKCL